MLSGTTRLLALISLGNCLVFAQGFRQVISGTVRDASGAVVQGAAVTVRHTETGLTRAAVTDVDGSYSLPTLPVGAYEITAQKPGFKAELVRFGMPSLVWVSTIWSTKRTCDGSKVRNSSRTRR